MKKRILSLVLVLVFVLALGVPAFAAGSTTPAVSSVTCGNKKLKGSTVEGTFTVTIRFNCKMAKYAEANKKLITLKNGDQSVPVTVDFDGEKTFGFTVKHPEAGDYTLTIGSKMKADSGKTLGKAYRVKFTVKQESMFKEILSLLRDFIDKMLKTVGLGGGLGNLGEDVESQIDDAASGISDAAGGLGDAAGGIGDAIGGIAGGGLPDLGGIGDAVGGLLG